MIALAVPPVDVSTASWHGVGAVAAVFLFLVVVLGSAVFGVGFSCGDLGACRNPIGASRIGPGTVLSRGPTRPQHPPSRGAFTLTSVDGATGPALPLQDTYRHIPVDGTPGGTQADYVRGHRVRTSCSRRESSMGMN